MRIQTTGAVTALAAALVGCGAEGSDGSAAGSTTGSATSGAGITLGPRGGSTSGVGSGATAGVGSGATAGVGSGATSGGASGPPLAARSVALVSSTARVGQEVVGLALRFDAGGPAAAELQGFTVKASGSIEEDQDLGELKVVGDDSADAVADPGEPVLATVAAPAFPQDDASVSVQLNQPVTIAPGQSLQLLVVVDVTASGQSALDLPGESLELQVETAGDVAASSGGQAITPAGSFPLTGRLLLELNDHLLISEIVRDPWEGEYVEVFNPTAYTADLTDVYLTDYTDDSESYWSLPTGDDFRPGFFSGDHLVRFPAGDTLAPGAAVTVARNGYEYAQYHFVPPDYAIGSDRNCEHMLTADSSNPPSWDDDTPWGIGRGLRNRGESVVLFTWDGASDRVRDLDYVFYGSESSSDRNVRIDKSGESVDGPDANGTPESFLPETPAGQQATAPTADDPDNAIQRVDFGEVGETRTGGNGITGHDETSEPWGTTFTTGRPTPGRP